MPNSLQRVVLISDFTVNTFAGYLRNDLASPELDVSVAPFGQAIQVLVDDQHECWRVNTDAAVVWTLPMAVINSFRKVLESENVDLDLLLEEVDEYCSILRKLQGRLKWVFVPTWTLPLPHRGLGTYDLRRNGIAYTLKRMNLRLIESLADARNIIVVDADKWISKAACQAFNPKLWYWAKIPFSSEVYKEAARDIKACIRGMSGSAKKVLILDLDDTLWDGVVGDVGWENIGLGGHDPVGEALVDFQKQIKALKNKGVVLAVVSKNEESVALEAIRKHPEMVIKEEDLAAWRINWRDKAENILEIVEELNVTLDSVVFIDDNPRERARVKEALPEVAAPDLPTDKLQYGVALMEMDYFDTDLISDEDRQRSAMYVSERRRASLKEGASSLDGWLKSLDTCITPEPLDSRNINRVVQLLNKTNQMNLSTRRMTTSELTAWTNNSNRELFAFRVADRFGDSGLTGILSLETASGSAQAVDFILSCRIMGRKVEHAMLSAAVEWARSRGAARLSLRYLATTKNKPFLDFLLSSGLVRQSEDSFAWEIGSPYPAPPYITCDFQPFTLVR